jgi:hypothetical protein
MKLTFFYSLIGLYLSYYSFIITFVIELHHTVFSARFLTGQIFPFKKCDLFFFTFDVYW